MEGEDRGPHAPGLPPDKWDKNVFENVAVGIAVAELDGRYLIANSAFEKMFGYTEAELQELTPLDLTEGADRTAIQEFLSKLSTGVARQYQVETHARCKNGSRIWVRKTVSRIPAGPGSPGFKFSITENITGSKCGGDELRTQYEILLEVFDRIPLMINFTDEDGRIRLVNREWERILGWSWEEIHGRGIDVFAECYPEPQYRREVMDFIAASRGEWADFKTRLRDGRTIDTTWTVVRLPDGMAVGIGAESTNRSRAEEALRENEQHVQQIANHLREAVWMLDPKSRRVVYVSPAYERIWGRSAGSLYGDRRSSIDAIHPEDRQRVLDALEDEAHIRLPGEMSYRVVRPDGSTRWIRERSFPLRNAAGEVYRFVAVAEDITERKRAEEKLSRTEAYLAESERLSHIGTWAVRIPSREITYWSNEHYRIFGFDPEKGPPPVEAALARIHPEDGAVRETIIRGLSEKKDFELDFRVLRPDGSIRFVHSLGHPVLNGAREMVEFVGTAMDVTERKLAEDALQRSVEQFRALAAWAEGIREEDRTRLARELHDELGQALTAIKMDLKSLIHHPAPHWRERIKKSQDALKLIDEAIQSVQRISTELRPGILDDLGLVAALEWASGGFAARTGIKCIRDLPPGDLAIEPGAATALFRILQEALTNIARHADATEFKVRLAHDGSDLCMEISDNGKGFEEAQTVPGKLLGILGMRERALLLKGHVTIRSSPGKGATITVRIPPRKQAN